MRMIFIHKSRSIRKRTSEFSDMPRSFSDKLQRVNKNHTKHFPLCYLFILLVLRFICELSAKGFE